MTKQELKKVINKAMGFAINKIVLLECDRDGKYIMFEVCGTEYQMRREYYPHEWRINVYQSENTWTVQ